MMSIPAMSDLSVPLDELFDANVLQARSLMIGSLGYDPVLAPGFWESWVATHTTGQITPHKHAYDVFLRTWRDLHLEVKFSRAFNVAFSIRPRRCFKWLLTLPQMKRAKRPDAVVLIGVDKDRVWTWCAPFGRLGRSITVTVPNTRIGFGRGFDELQVPPTDLLPAILRTCSSTTHKANKALGDLFDADD